MVVGGASGGDDDGGVSVILETELDHFDIAVLGYFLPSCGCANDGFE